MTALSISMRRAHPAVTAALVVAASCSSRRTNLIRVADPKRAVAPLIALFAPPEEAPIGIDPGAHVAASVTLGARVYVAAGAHVGGGTVLGDDVRIHANAVLGHGCILGDGSVIHPNVTIYARTRIGRRVVVHAGSVIGSDGFGYTPQVEGMQKIPHLGIVEIEDDVEIGANCAIDRATLEVTRIRAGTKIDNLVHVGHNSDVGRCAVLVAQVGVAGSVTIGDGAMLGGQAGISDHVKVGPNALIGAQAGVHADVAGGEWLGTPALPRERAGRVFAALPHLPEYRERVRALEAQVAELRRAIEALREGREVADTKSS